MTNSRHSVTVFGAIGSALKKPVYMLGAATNIVEFHRFIKLVEKQIRPGLREKPFLLYDMHSAHVSSEAEIRNRFIPLPQPTQSSPFNCIETVWSLAKRYYVRLSLLHRATFGEKKFYELVLLSCRSADLAIPNILRVNHGYIREYLA